MERMMQGRNMCGEIWKVRHNVTDISSINAFAGVRGGSGGEYKDVYFVRMLGMNTTYTDEIGQMDRLLSEEASKGRLKYKRISELPRLAASEDVNYYSGCYDNWIGSSRKLLKIRASEQNEKLKAVLGYACGEAVRLFGKVTPHASASMEKNFAVKLMFWADQAGKELLNDFQPEGIMKLAASNLSKKQEYIFAYFMTLLGADVLLLQYQSDIDAQMEGLHLSKKVQLGGFGSCTLPVYQPDIPHAPSGSAQPKVNRVRRPLEVRMAGASGTGRSGVQAPGPSGSGTAGTGGSVSAASGQRGTVTSANRAGTGVSGAGRILPGPGNAGNGTRRELDFEELARLASSVVMISVHDNKGQILGNGSGIMIGEEGYILTNHHVASGGRSYSVRIEDDDTIYKTDEVIKYNSVLDLAVIRINRRLKPLPIYRGGRKLVRGQKVVAIGSPLGLFNSVSDGIISGFRVIDNVDMIQFTAPISHGSSGGAVLNMYGEVIGISTAGFDNGQNINLAVGYEFISQFVCGFTGQHGK